MQSALLQYTVIGIVTVLLTRPIEIECCSMSTNDIISLMSRDPNYKNDPCYIQWQATQDQELNLIWRQRAEVEKIMQEYDETKRLYDAQERENRQRSYVSTTERTTKKESELLKVLGIICLVAIVGICCCAACVAATQNDEGRRPSTNVPSVNRPEYTHLITPFVPSSTLTHQPTLHPSTANDNNLTIPSMSHLPQEPSTNVSLMPSRQDSLPSYDDAVIMPCSPSQQ